MSAHLNLMLNFSLETHIFSIFPLVLTAFHLVRPRSRDAAMALTMTRSYGSLKESMGLTDGEAMKLHVILEQDEDGYFVAEVPALPGCLSQGKTREDALANIKEAVEGWLEVMESKRALRPEQMVAVNV